MNEPQLVALYLPIGVLEKLEQVAPVRKIGHMHTLFGVQLMPNRTIPQDQWGALYEDNELVMAPVKEGERVGADKVTKISLP